MQCWQCCTRRPVNHLSCQQLLALQPCHSLAWFHVALLLRLLQGFVSQTRQKEYYQTATARIIVTCSFDKTAACPLHPGPTRALRQAYTAQLNIFTIPPSHCLQSCPSCMQWCLRRDEKPADALTVRHGPETDDYNRDFIERDERRLADLGRKTVEMYVIAHVIADLEVRS